MIPYLLNPNVFACHCELMGNRIRVGILIISEDFASGLHHLYSESGDRYSVTIPDLIEPTYQIDLEYVPNFQVSKAT